MYLKDYFFNVDKKFGKTFFSGVSSNSSLVKKDSIFFAIKGNSFDGNDFIKDAIKKGARIIFSEKKIEDRKKNIIYIKSSNVRKLLSRISYKIINQKFKKLIAVTGTNGKSSVADFYYQILNLNLKKVASIGTIGVRTKDKKKSLDNTTLGPIQLSRILKELKNKKIDYIIMEASSHGLKQNRLDGLLFDVGIFTNLSHDHLDYHKSMKDYLNSKLYLFKKLIKKKGAIVTDQNIPQINKIKRISSQKRIHLNLIFNKKIGIELISHKFENERQIIEIKFKNKQYKIILNLIGKVQVKNILMSVLAAYESNLSFKNIIKVIHRIKPVEGRLEKIGNIRNNSKVILDYAHTPEALKLALSNLKEQFPLSKLNLVFGCGGNRDYKKRSKMGKIADIYADRIYLTDDNPRNESPSKIRKDIKKGIKEKNIEELPNRKHAIHQSIQNLKTGEILLIAGKGHEKIQDYGKKKLFFSDKKIILNSIKFKNKFLSNNIKINIIKEKINTQLPNNLVIKNASINSKTIKKNDIFFAIKGKKIDGNKFVSEAFKKKSSLAIVNDINKKLPLSKQIKVRDPLNFLTNCSRSLRENLDAKIISITGSCGKTTLKEMLGFILKQISCTTISPKSFNNKYGVPLSLFNLKQNDDFGVFEVGMDKKGEIDYLSNIIKPDLGIITNISYAHSKNFKTINNIAEAKAEIINNIKSNGSIVLNSDDNFFQYHKRIARKKKLKVLSFGIQNKMSFTKLIRIKKRNSNEYELLIRINNSIYSFYSKNKNKNNIYNILASLTALYFFLDIEKLKKDIFLNFELPVGRGDITNLNIKGKNINFVDETYNSNPLSVRVALENFDKIPTKKNKKYLILGDMLELGKHSTKQHKLLSREINRTNINKVYVVGKYIKKTFANLKPNKKGKILIKNFNIINLIKDDLENNDYLMIKGSNATGLNEIAHKLKQGNLNVIWFFAKLCWVI